MNREGGTVDKTKTKGQWPLNREGGIDKGSTTL